jgi:hypothetical protein
MERNEKSFRKAKRKRDQTGQNPVSSATGRQDKSKKRKEYLTSLEADARAFVEGCQTAKAISDEAIVLHRRFRDVVEQMRPVFERVRTGFAHLRKDETIMGERTGPAWAMKYIGLSYDYLCRRLNPPKGTLLLPDGTRVVAPSAGKSDHSQEKEETPRPKLTQKLPTIPTADTADWTDNAYIKTCMDFFESTLRPLESDPGRFHLVATAIAYQILGDMGNEQNVERDSELAAVNE